MGSDTRTSAAKDLGSSEKTREIFDTNSMHVGSVIDKALKEDNLYKIAELSAAARENGMELPPLKSLEERTVTLEFAPSGFVRCKSRPDVEIRKILARVGWGQMWAEWEKVPVTEDTIKFLKNLILATFESRIKHGLYILGKPQIGKTSLAWLIAKFAAKNYRISPYFVSISNFEEDNNLRKFAPLLFIDEIESFRYKSLERIESIIFHRYQHNLLTYVTSNISLEDLAQRDGFEGIAHKFDNGRFIQEFVLSYD